MSATDIMTELEREVLAFQDRYYPRQDLPARLRKLGEEVGELAEAIARGEQEGIIMEAADCGIVLTGIVGSLGFSFAQMMWTKLFILQDRKEEKG